MPYILCFPYHKQNKKKHQQNENKIIILNCFSYEFLFLSSETAPSIYNNREEEEEEEKTSK